MNILNKYINKIKKVKYNNFQRRVWVEIDVDGYSIFERPEHQGGNWILANKMKVNKIIG